MNFIESFWSVLRLQPGRALAALYWHATGRKVRARNRLRIAIAQGPDAYEYWINKIERRDASTTALGEAVAAWAYRPVISVLVHQRADFDQDSLDDLVRSLRAQIYPRWELIVVPSPTAPPLDAKRAAEIRIAEQFCENGGAALQAAADLAQGEYLLPLPPGAILPRTALFRYGEALQADAADLLFGDHDTVDKLGKRRRPWFKPQWNAELALAQDYVSQAFIISATAAREVLAGERAVDRAAPYALALAVACRPDALVRHVGHIQAHIIEGMEISSLAERTAVVRTQLSGTGATVSEGAHGTTRVDWPLPNSLPLVTIIIPTRDRIDLLRACLASLDALTTYRFYEVIVVDNGSVREDSLAYLRDIGRRDDYRVIRDDRPYNYAQLNNHAVGSARGDFLCFLNNDTEVIDGDWLTAMMRHAVRSHVGAVGARLLYDDGTIQHAGVGIGLGDAAGHSHRFQKKDDFGYFARTHAAHYASAVTAACLTVEKTKFLEVGGFDEDNLAVAFNDVDLCLKLQRAGWRNVYTPHATLLHHESKSRGKDFSPQHIARYRRELETLQTRWETPGYLDPLHHAELDRASETYLIRL